MKSPAMARRPYQFIIQYTIISRKSKGNFGNGRDFSFSVRPLRKHSAVLRGKDASIRLFGVLNGLDLLQRPAGTGEVGGHHRVHRDSQIHIVAIGIGAGGHGNDLAPWVFSSAPPLLPREMSAEFTTQGSA